MIDQSGTARAESFLLAVHRALLALLWGVGAVFVLRYRSEGAVVGPYSTRYLLGVILPFAMIAVLLALETKLPRLGGSLLSRRVAGAAASLAALGSGLYALKISDEFVSLLILLLAPCLVAQVWARAAGRAALLPATALALGAGLVLFVAEVPALVTGSPLVVWGDTTTFASLFPRQAPFIGRGGRLRPNLNVLMRSPDYPRGARLVTNSAGFRNRGEFAAEPARGELRLLSLGDSFSTGFCADQEAFFGSLLEARLGRAGIGAPVLVMNAEVSDPAYGLHYLQEHGPEWRPRLVLYGLSGNDLMQAEQFYGSDRLFRLDPDGRLEPNPDFDPGVGSAWERYSSFAYPAAGRGAREVPALAGQLAARLARFKLLSRLAVRAGAGEAPPVPMPGYADTAERADGRKRLIDGASNLGFFYPGEHEPIERSYAAFTDLLAAMAATARAAGARLILVVHPQRCQVQPADWEAMVERWSLDPARFDLRLLNRRLEQIARQAGVPLCDLTEAFAAAAPRGGLYLPGGDTHYNRRGHEVAAEAAAKCVEDLISGPPGGS